MIDSNASAYELWCAWYAMEDTRPTDSASTEYAAWAAECARLYVAAKAAERAHPAEWVQRARANTLPSKDYTRA